MLRPEEIDLIKWNLGVSVTRLGAEPYLSYVAVFDRAVQPYLFDNSTTSSTAVLASAGLTSITLAANPTAASGNGLTFQAGTSILVDLGVSQETTVVQSITGLVVTCTLSLAHAGTYQVIPNGSEQLIRNILARLETLRVQIDTIAPQTAGMQQVDEIQLYGMTKGGRRGSQLDKFAALVMQREQARDDLGEAIGYPNLRTQKKASGGFSFEVY